MAIAGRRVVNNPCAEIFAGPSPYIEGTNLMDNALEIFPVANGYVVKPRTGATYSIDDTHVFNSLDELRDYLEEYYEGEEE